MTNHQKHHWSRHSKNAASQALREYLLKGQLELLSPKLHVDYREISQTFKDINQWYFRLVYRLEKVICKVLQYYLPKLTSLVARQDSAIAYNAENRVQLWVERSAEEGNVATRLVFMLGNQDPAEPGSLICHRGR